MPKEMSGKTESIHSRAEVLVQQSPATRPCGSEVIMGQVSLLTEAWLNSRFFLQHFLMLIVLR